MRNYAALGACLALLCSNEYLTLGLLLIGLTVFLCKIFAAASERSW